MACQTLYEQQIRQQLADVLASKSFATTPRLRQFLQFVVEKSLAGEAEEIKEFVVATEVYGRDATYNPQIDSTVRVEASRLRSKLRAFYESEGHNASVEIQLPRGTYVPVFIKRCSPADDEAAPPRPSHQHLWARGGLAVAGVMALLLWVSQTGVQARTVFDAEPHVRDLYLRAQKLLRTPVTENGWPVAVPAPVAESIRLFSQLTKDAPEFAPGWVGLAEAHEWAYELDRDHPQYRIEQAKQALDRALAVNPACADAWSRLASIYFHRTGDLVRAEEAARKAIELNPRDIPSHTRLADLLRVRGEFSEAKEIIDRAISLEPANPKLWSQRAVVFYNVSRYEEALTAAEHALGLFAGNQQPLAWWAKGLSLERLGKPQEAEAAYRAGMDTHPQEVWNRSSLAHLLGKLGRAKEVQPILSELIRQEEAGKGVCVQIAIVYVGLGRMDDALTWLERGHAAGQTNMPFVPLEKRFDPLKDHPRFQALLRTRMINGEQPAVAVAQRGKASRV